jgi:hypothetical protein
MISYTVLIEGELSVVSLQHDTVLDMSVLVEDSNRTSHSDNDQRLACKDGEHHSS